MRRGFLRSIAAVAAGAGGALAQPPAPAGEPPAPAAVSPAGDVMPANGPGGSGPAGLTPPGLRPVGPAPALMPPLAPGPQGDPQGLGPAAGYGPPPGPMYPNPGPYGAPTWQPAPNGGGPGGTGAGAAPHFWTRFEYLMWFNNNQTSRYPLLTTSALSDRGLLGRSSTLVLAGGELDAGTLSGFRVTTGFYGDADRRYGFEASGFLLPEQSYKVDITTSPTGIPVLARPFVSSTNPGGTDSLVVASPNFVPGPFGGVVNGPVAARAVVDANTSTWSIEANGLLNLFRSEPGCKTLWSIDALAGYRFFELDEELAITTTSRINIPDVQVPIFATGPFGIRTLVGTQPVPVPVNVGGVTVFNPATITVADRFRVENRFNGGNFGLRAEVRRGMWSVMATGKIAVGNMEYRATVDGSTSFADLTRPSPAGQFVAGRSYGGLLANASNIGRYNDDEFVVIPEGTLNVGVALTRTLTGFVGYNYLYVSDVVRPASLAGPLVNPATVPFSPAYGTGGRATPRGVILEKDEYWVHGVNFGLQLRY